jgi:VanZ family protein
MKEKNTLIFFFLMLFIFAFAFDPGREIDKKVLENHDKFKHIGAFVLLSYFLYESSIIIPNYYKFIILSAFAFFIEYVQSMTGREASLNDFIASIFGITLFVFSNFLFRKFKNNQLQ